MSNSQRLQLPFVQAAQAQKHITVNEALVRLDGLVNLTLASVDTVTPPNNPLDGEVYAVPSGATGDWSGLGGAIAIASNGGWVFVVPTRGWRAWVDDVSETAIFDGQIWRVGAHVLSATGAETVLDVIETSHVVTPGATNLVVSAIPQGAMVIGVTGRVTSQITGTLTSWRVGVQGSDNRYGSGLGIAAQSWLNGMSSGPLAYYSDTDLLLTAEGGDFAAGEISFAVHVLKLVPPS